MKIACIGTGPAAFAFGLALKRLDPAHQVEFFEESAASAGDYLLSHRFSTGVAPRLHAQCGVALTPATWTTVTVRNGGAHTNIHVDSRGAIRRSDVRERLREAACAQDLPVSDRRPSPEALAAFDLIVVENDDALTQFSEIERLDGQTRLVAVETAHVKGQVFEVARRNSGIFFGQGHPIGGDRGLFIVEARDEAWAEEGLDRADPDRLSAFCVEAFPESIGGGPLVAGPLQRVAAKRRRKFQDGKVVLVGDAAHSFHHSLPTALDISIGDGLFLAEQIAKNDQVADALEKYEIRRRSIAESGHRASELLLDWVENIERYIALPPARFAFALLARSMRVNHADLRRQDPTFVERADGEFAKSAGGNDDTPPPPMFVPFDLRNTTLVNRIGAAPLCMYMSQEGTPTDFHMAHLGSFALGGAGLIFTEMTAVSPEARLSLGCAGMYRPEHVEAWRRIVNMVHDFSSAKICLQLGHGGRRSSAMRPWEGNNQPIEEGGWPRLAPSIARYTDSLPVDRAMTYADMDKVIADFVQAAERATQAGFDLLELHMAHGYLLSTFLSAASNFRNDEFGGSLENRARLPLAVLEAVRAVWAEKPLSVRFSAVDWSSGIKSSLDEAVEIAAMFKDAGADIIGVSSGNVVNVRRPATGRLFQAHFSDRVRNEVKVPTMSFGRMASIGDVNAMLLAGRCDLCLLGKGHLYDPYFTRHAARELDYRGIKIPNPHLAAKEFTPRRG
jgi:anthraniloyl-CoA monooxygenase